MSLRLSPHALFLSLDTQQRKGGISTWKSFARNQYKMAYVPPHRRGGGAAPDGEAYAAPRPDWRRADRQRGATKERPFGLADPAACACDKKGDARYCIYINGHSFAKGGSGGGGGSQSLLGTSAQFCASFFHIEPTAEGGIDELCLSAACGGLPCPRKSVVCVLRLQDTARGEDVFVARYSNCWQGGSEANVHAERFLLSDARLRDALEALPPSGGQLLLYLTYQPCHHSGGHRRSGMGEHTTSCTTLLLDHLRNVLAPRHVSLHVKIAYIYRAHWSPTTSAGRRYAPAVQAARQGLQLLREGGVKLSALSPDDWDWLAAQCDDDVSRAWAEGGPPLHRASREARARMDAFIASFLQAEAEGRDAASASTNTADLDAVPAHTNAASTEDRAGECEPCAEIEGMSLQTDDPHSGNAKLPDGANSH